MLRWALRIALVCLLVPYVSHAQPPNASLKQVAKHVNMIVLHAAEGTPDVPYNMVCTRTKNYDVCKFFIVDISAQNFHCWAIRVTGDEMKLSHFRDYTPSNKCPNTLPPKIKP